VTSTPSNIGVARALHAYCVSDGVRAREQEIRALPLSLDLKVSYWWPFIMVVGAHPLMPFSDPRRSRRLTALGRSFVLSMMHQAIREPDPDLAAVRLGIFQFDALDDGSRMLRLYTEEGVPFFGFAELDEMIRETYAIWAEVLDEREAEVRRRDLGTRGPLLLRRNRVARRSRYTKRFRDLGAARVTCR
jgi:hypothetical protein